KRVRIFAYNNRTGLNETLTREKGYWLTDLQIAAFSVSARSKKESRYCDQANNVAGEDFLLLTKEALRDIGLSLGSAQVLVGSRPPPNDSLWARIQEQGFEDPGILVLIAGDRGYKPIIKRALKHNWTVETWFWHLDDSYRSFSYGLGPDPTGENQVLEITNGDIIQNLEDEDIMKWLIL
ncbi:3588_t:CDS:2, partial [Ambispora gerdemannii]